MKDKLDEICAKYHLNLLGKMYVDPDEAAACKALGIQGNSAPAFRRKPILAECGITRTAPSPWRDA